MAEINFQSNPNDASEGFPVIPAGEYVASITSSEVKKTKAGDGSYLNLQWTILEGQYKNQKLFEILNLWNPNQQAKQISERALSAICVALGIPGIKDSAELHNKAMLVKIGVRKDNNGNDQNVIQKHSAYSGQSAAAPVAPGGMPWEKK